MASAIGESGVKDGVCHIFVPHTTAGVTINEGADPDVAREAAAIVAKGREASAIEREQAMAQLKRDFGRLLVETTSKVTGKVLSPADHQTINQETVNQISR